MLVALLGAAAGAGTEDAARPKPTLAQLVGQRFIFAFAGIRPPAALVERIEKGQAAGVIIFARNFRSVAGLRRLTARLQRIPQPPGLELPLLVMADQEGGSVKRIPGAPTLSPPHTPTAAAAFDQGAAAAATLRGAGVNVDLAPVVDVARNGSAIADEGRSYGRDPASVSGKATAFLRGLTSGGVAGTAKHFPGFGAARVNTDFGPVKIRLSLADLTRTDLPPFRAMVGAGVPLVMLDTAIYPALSSRPAALSRPIATKLLRATVGFEGVSISDDLGAPSLAAFGGPARVGLAAAHAGIDLMLFAGSYREGALAANALLSAARRHEISRTALTASFERVRRLRESFGSG